MTTLAALAAAHVDAHADTAVVVATLGTADAGAAAASIESWCRRHLGSSVQDAWLWRVSVGCVAGLRLADGREVVVKAYSPDRTVERIDRVLAAQRHAAACGLPCATPLTAPEPLGLGLATAETALRAGRRAILTVEPDRTAAAHGWHAVTRAFDGHEHLAPVVAPSAPATDLYPTPHSPVFDFVATAAGAEWIDALARRARAVMDAADGPLILHHSDWRGDNLRVSDDGVCVAAIFDWDSLAVGHEAIAVGLIAAMHSVDWSGPDDPYFATAEECTEFVVAIEAAGGRPFTTAEWRTGRAAIVFGWSYTARCEHARAAAGHDDPRFRMRARLRADGRRLLDD